MMHFKYVSQLLQSTVNQSINVSLPLGVDVGVSKAAVGNW